MILLVCVLVSGLCLSLLALFDAKRLRWRQRLARRSGIPLRVAPLSKTNRRLLSAMLIAPGLILVGAGMWAGLLLWLGFSLSYGWLLTEALAARSQ